MDEHRTDVSERERNRRRLSAVTLIPLPILVIIAVCSVLAGCLILLSLVLGTAGNSVSADLHYQCDTAVGPDPSFTETPATSAVSTTARAAPVTAPSTNPYAGITTGADDTGLSQWQRDCIAAMWSAPYQLPALRVPNTGPAVECAGHLAMRQAGTRWDTGPDGASEPADLARSVVYSAELAVVTGSCELVAAPVPAAGSSGCRPVLPATIAGQGVCGQRVDPSAASMGDLVFWEFRGNAPTRVGVVVADGRIVTGNPAAGDFRWQALPHGDDVRVKRVLGAGGGS